MYTVKELIEALKKCPKDYRVMVADKNFYLENVESVGIKNDNEIVNLFLERG